jgi:hypothetical protein
MNSSIWQYHQIVIDGTSQDTVSTAGWTLLTTGMLMGGKLETVHFMPTTSTQQPMVGPP